MPRPPSRLVRSQPADVASPKSVTPEMLHRQPSESGASSHGPSKKWRIPMMRKKPSILSKDGKSWTSRSTDTDSHDSLGIRADAGTSSLHDSSDSSHRQLRDVIQRARTGPTGPKEVDGAYEVYSKYKEKANALCYAVLQDEFKPARHASSAADALPRRGSSLESPNGLYDQRSSFSGRSLTEVVTGSGRSTHLNDTSLNTVREWRLYLESLADWLKINLAETYRKFEHDATPEMVEALFNSKRFRREAVHRMRNASVTRVMSADPQFFPRYEIRFRNYEKVKQELVEIRSLVQAGESGISPDRKIDEITIASQGDAILEFANLDLEATANEPVLRFRVTSHVLRETSPIFARMFSGHSDSLYLHDDDDVNAQLPPPAGRYVCRDGSEAKVYRMPQLETNHLQSLEILLHAAHMHNEKTPREVSFEQFVAIAECCMRYKCTSPLELIVEHRWLPQWMHKGADDMPDGMLAISYAFGLRSLFTRMSKSAILNLVDERDLQSKPWPQRIKDKIWAVRCAKMAQVHACCTSTIQEYIPQPSRNPADEVQPVTPSDLRNNHYTPASPPKPATSALSTTPRCPKGSHWCDAGNLGWMMLLYNELNLLFHILHPSVVSHLPDSVQQPSRSLAQIVEALRRIPSPVSPIHPGGVCDPSPAFRSAVSDIFNSVSGLTLYEASGKSHGWALSKHRRAEPQQVITWGLNRMAGNDRNHHGVATEFPEHIRLKVLSYIEDLEDLHAAAVINRLWYNTYMTHELFLMRNILRAGRIRSGTGPRQPVLPKSVSNAEEKVPKEVSDEIRDNGRDSTDAMTIRTEEDDESDFDDGESIDGTPAPSITESLWKETRLRLARSRSTDQDMGGRLAGRIPEPHYAVPPPHPPPPCDDIPRAGIPSTDSSLSTPRQTPPPGPTTTTSPRSVNSKPDGVNTEYTDEPPLTDEEARRILWPDDDGTTGTSAPSQPTRAPAEGLREKFRFGDRSFTEGLEDKSLVVAEDKQLLSEHEVARKMAVAGSDM